jgi:hypothetical protein
MNIFLDDIRECPKDWVYCRWPSDVIKLIESGKKIYNISLDHDLGSTEIPEVTGNDVITYIEEKVFNGEITGANIPTILVHSDNSSGREKMIRGIKNIYSKLNLSYPDFLMYRKYPESFNV